MKDLLPEKAKLAEEFRAELKEQSRELIPHFPTISELEKANRVCKEMSKRTDYVGKELDEYVSIAGFSKQFRVYEGDQVVWYGHDISIISLEPSTCMNKEGKIGEINMYSDEDAGGFEGFDELTSEDSIIVNAPIFIFSKSEDMDKTINSWYMARKLINTWGAKLGVI
jgi:hypothetical protein